MRMSTPALINSRVGSFAGPWVTWAVEAISRYLMKELGTRLVDFGILVGLAIAVTRMQTILIPWLWYLVKKGWWYITLILACVGNLSFLIWLYYRTYTPPDQL